MVAVKDYTWEQGEDLILKITYKVDDEPVDLTSYSVRMDIAPLVAGKPGVAVYSFNSDDFDEPLDAEGDVDNEATLSEVGEIYIKIPRAITLPDGVIGSALPTQAEYQYDLFLRNNDTNTQQKLLQGKILVRESVTRWA